MEQAARLTAKLSHDFGNLLTGMLGFTELCLNQLDPRSLPHRFLGEVLQSAKEGADWVRKLQTSSRRSAAPDARCAPLDVIAQEQGRLDKAWAGKANLHAHLPPALPPVALNAANLQTLLMHLLDNARESLDQPGNVSLSARETTLSATECLALLGQPRPGRFVEIAIADTGRGLPPQVLSGRFDELFIATRVRHRGLGLGVVYGILASSGGGLAIASDQRGARVCVYLPVYHADAQDLNQKPAVKPPLSISLRGRGSG
jgi:signal transduction histidine kinase